MIKNYYQKQMLQVETLYKEKVTSFIKNKKIKKVTKLLAFKENIMLQDSDCVNIEGLIGNRKM